jgi:signal transduction histidine kinase/CheY-like chemotaxis protein
MRNPLSALIGCADEIVTCLKDYSTSLRTSGALSQNGILPTLNTSLPPIHLLDEAIEAADTIIYCAMHQKRIIDDILTLSRLDSNLLLVSPEPSEPIQLVRSAIKMFEAEVRRADVKLDLIEQESLSSLAIQWTLLDPSRVLQVLINLMTNAIKFTRTEPKREIKITVGASLDKPSEVNEFGVEYVPKTHLSPDQTTKSEWGSGPILYLSITVQDTGRGLSAPETRNLFHLFQQASPKTYTQYGGSGLGLFISRQLVEMQGGEIGVKSASGVGSTFTFYVKTRRTSPPSDGKADRTDWQLLVRDDALREACGVEIPALKDGGSMADTQPAVQPRITLAPSVDAGGVLHILVVEDNLVNQKVVSKQLRKEGHIVSVANHGEEALDFIRRTRFWREGGEERLSVILLDLEMPVMDGITCVKVIREMEKSGEIRGHVPVIAVTANARKDQILRSLEAGMVSVPFIFNFLGDRG